MCNNINANNKNFITDNNINNNFIQSPFTPKLLNKNAATPSSRENRFS